MEESLVPKTTFVVCEDCKKNYVSMALFNPGSVDGIELCEICSKEAEKKIELMKAIQTAGSSRFSLGI